MLKFRVRSKLEVAENYVGGINIEIWKEFIQEMNGTAKKELAKKESVVERMKKKSLMERMRGPTLAEELEMSGGQPLLAEGPLDFEPKKDLKSDDKDTVVHEMMKKASVQEVEEGKNLQSL